MLMEMDGEMKIAEAISKQLFSASKLQDSLGMLGSGVNF